MKVKNSQEFIFKKKRQLALCFVSIICGSIFGTLLSENYKFSFFSFANNDEMVLSNIKIILFIGILAFTLFGVFVIPMVNAFYGYLLSYNILNHFGIALIANIILIMPMIIFLSITALDLSASFCGVSFLFEREGGGYKTLLYRLILSIIAAISVTLFVSIF